MARKRDTYRAAKRNRLCGKQSYFTALRKALGRPIRTAEDRDEAIRLLESSLARA